MEYFEHSGITDVCFKHVCPNTYHHSITLFYSKSVQADDCELLHEVPLNYSMLTLAYSDLKALISLYLCVCIVHVVDIYLKMT